MLSELDAFHEELFQDVQGSADANGRFVEDAFFERFVEYLVEAGEVVSADRAYFTSRGIRVDGYGGDPLDSDGVLSLFVMDYSPHSSIATLTGTEMDAAFNRVLKFAQKARAASFVDSLEETSTAFGVADLVSRRWAVIAKVRLFLITNRQLSARVDSRPEGEIDGIPVTYSVWDIERLYRFAAVGRGREPIDLDLEKDYGGPIAALPAHLDNADYEAYVAIVPGEQLAAIYDRWGARLLEQNVRSFLQARGAVNKGIRNTLDNTPEMFFAYNNGITGTAEEVEVRSTREGLRITRIRNLQIVNGGQTTASVYAASRRNVDLSRVFVQMKLSIIDSDRIAEVVPKISEYANSQNKVNAADFFANHEYHVRIEGFSRRVYAPPPEGTFRQSKWFYERARGQYQDARAYLSPAKKKQFDLEYPKHQLFNKTDLAKYINVWEQIPHTVSLGAQKNFIKFADMISAEWETAPDTFNEMYYREAIAKAIVFRETERLISSQPWYSGGYRAQLVAYAISKLSHDVAAIGCVVDFDRLWKTQSVPAPIRAEIARRAKVAFDIIGNPPAGMSNVTEWAKKPACWERLAAKQVPFANAFTEYILDRSEKQALRKAAVKEQKVVNGIQAQTRVVMLGAGFWRSALKWGIEKKVLSEAERGVLEVASQIPTRLPTERQAAVALTALARMEQEGMLVPDERAG